MAIYNLKADKPQVQLFEGKEAARQVYQKCISLNEVWFFGTVGEMMFTEDFNLFLQRVKSGQLKARDLFVTNEKDLAFAKSLKPQSNYKIRFLPEEAKDALTDFALFGNSVAFFSFKPQIFAVIITSKQVAGTFRLLYESAWKIAQAIGQEK